MSTEQRYLEVVKKADILGKVLDVYGDSENPLFLAKDISEWIGHTNVTEMCRNLEEGTEKLNSIILSAGQNREMTFLTEDGVYEVLFTSRKPIAKEIKKGVKEFLKAWRKGEVKVVQKQMSELDMIISMANMQKDIKDRVETLEEKINNRMTIESREQNIIHSTLKRVVYKRADQLHHLESDKKIARKLLFPAIHREFRNKFGIVSYKDVKISDYDDSLLFIKSWREDQNTRDRISKEVGDKNGK